MVETIEFGTGDRIVFVHGDVFDAMATWPKQLALQDDYHLVLVNRRGFGGSAGIDGEDFQVDAEDLVEVLGQGAHLVGHSYGAVVALLAAGARPDLVWSLTVFEPPAFGLVAERDDVRAFRRRIEEITARRPDPETFLRQFIEAVGGDPSRLPSPVPPSMLNGARLQLRGRWPWEAEIDLDALAAAPFATLVVSGGHSAMFDSVCDMLETRLRARREVLAGAGHGIPTLGEPVNALLRSHLAAAGPS